MNFDSLLVIFRTILKVAVSYRYNRRTGVKGYMSMKYLRTVKFKKLVRNLLFNPKFLIKKREVIKIEKCQPLGRDQTSSVVPGTIDRGAKGFFPREKGRLEAKAEKLRN